MIFVANGFVSDLGLQGRRALTHGLHSFFRPGNESFLEVLSRQ